MLSKAPNAGLGELVIAQLEIAQLEIAQLEIAQLEIAQTVKRRNGGQGPVSDPGSSAD